jgi:hypothetical protein
MEVAADRLSIRWFLGYDLNEPLPDYSSLTRIGERYGLGVFRRFFERIVELCAEAGLVWVEPLFTEAKDWHGLRRFRLRGLERVMNSPYAKASAAVRWFGNYKKRSFVRCAGSR